MESRMLIFFSMMVWILIPTSANAVVFGGSNLGFEGYPSDSCVKPIKPIKPYSFNSQLEIDSYNTDVDLYNTQLQQYLSCIKEYIENANNDIKRIKEKEKEAIDEATH